MTNTTCATCAGPLPDSKNGRPRKFCSEQCGRKAHGTSSTRRCSIEDCQGMHVAKGLCKPHWKQQYQPPKRPVECPTCGNVTHRRDVVRKGTKATGFCSLECRDAWRSCQPDDPMWKAKGPAKTKSILPTDHPVRELIRANTVRMSPHRAAWEAGDHAAFIETIRGNTHADARGCWNWAGRLRDGYPQVRYGSQSKQVHRLVLEAKHGGKSLGKQAAHHMCANSACVNPEHLQPVTARDNTAEMLARTYMETRIADLEAALAAHDPGHPLLQEIGVILPH